MRDMLFSGERVINFRPVFLLAVGAALTAFAAYSLGTAALWAALLPAACGGIAVVWRFRKKQRISGAIAFTVLLTVLFCAVAGGFCAVRSAYERAPAYAGECTVTGTVREVSFIDRGCRLTLDGLGILHAGGYDAPAYKMYLYVYGGEAFSAGTRVRFTAEIETLDFESYGNVNVNAVLDGVKYRASGAYETIERIGTSFDLFGAVRDRMRAVLFEGMDAERARIAYAMLTGDSGLIDEGMLDSFRYGGVAHVFAVSGLHIGVVYGLIAFPLRKWRAKGAVRLPIVAAVLLFYAGVCGFSPSSVRALVMCLALALADACGMKYDALHSVSLAALLVMLVNPVYFFQVGFRLSVAAAGGIIVTGGALTRLFARIRRMPRKLSSAIAVSLSAQLATFPILLDAFGYVSALSLFLNLIFVPLISFVYAVLFVCALIACLFPFGAGVLLWVPEWMLVLAQMPVLAFDWRAGLICGFVFGGAAVLWFLTLFVLSDKVNLRALPRCALALTLTAAMTVSMLAGNGAFAGTTLRLYARYGTDLLFFGEGASRCLVLTGAPDPEYAERFFLREGADELAAVFLVCEGQEADAALAAVSGFADIGRAYISADADWGDSFRGIEAEGMRGAFSAAGVYAEFVCAEGLLLTVDGVRILIAGENLDTDAFYGADLLIAENYSAAAYAACLPAAEAYFEKAPGKISVYGAGDLQISLKGGIISCKGKGGGYEVRIV